MLRYILITISAYIYIFNPVFSILPNTDSLMILYPLIFLFFKDNYRKDFKKYNDILKYWVLIFVFISLRTLFGGDQVYIYSWIGYLIETVFITFFLSKIIASQHVNIVKLLLLTSSIAATISCLCLFLPFFDAFIRTIQIEYTEVNSQRIFRAFGLAQGLNFEFGIIQGLILGIGLFYIKKHRWYIMFIPFVIISILINARTGFIVVILALFFYLFSNRNYKTLLGSFVLFLLISMVYSSLENFIPTETFLWIEEFFLELEDVIMGTANARYNTNETLQEMLIWPKDLFAWIFGTGYSLFRVKSGAHSDVGYINQLAYGGIIYVILLYRMCYIMVKRCRNIIPFYLFLFLILSVLIVNFKGSVFGNNGGIFKVLVLFSFSLYQVDKIKLKKSEL